MAKTPTRQTAEEQAADLNGRTPLERMTDLTRRILAVPKAEVIKPKKRKPKRKHAGRPRDSNSHY